MKIALITGITGQDGSFLAELLLEKEYKVWGIIRRSSQINTQRIENIFKNENLILKYGDLIDSTNISKILSEINNTYDDIERLEVYNLGAMSHVKISFEMPEYTGDVDALGVLRLLEALRGCDIPLNKIRFYQASTSEIFGKIENSGKGSTEETPFYPKSPYGVAKLYGYWITKNYRESYNMYACNGILFNHESERRGFNFVTRKITLGLKMILSGERDKLVIGNINALRDWGYAKDFCKGMISILNNDKPDDYVLATGENHSVREFIEEAFKLRGFNIQWKGSNLNEIGYDINTNRELIFISEKYYRPNEVDELLGDYSKAKKELNWSPQTSFKNLVKIMVDYDCPL